MKRSRVPGNGEGDSSSAQKRVSRARTCPEANGVALNGHYALFPVRFFTLLTCSFIIIREWFRVLAIGVRFDGQRFYNHYYESPTSGGQGLGVIRLICSPYVRIAGQRVVETCRDFRKLTTNIGKD